MEENQQPKKKSHILRNILIALVTIIVLAAVSMYCVWNFYIKPKYSDKIMTAVSLIMDDDELMSELSEVINDEQVQKDLEAAVSDEQLSEDIQNALGGEDVQPSDAPNGEAQPTAVPNGGAAQSAPNTQPAPEQQPQSEPAPTKKPAKKQSLMERAKENVDPKDFATGMKIANKLDVGYLMGLMSGGLTAEEKAEAKKYVKSRISGSEIATMKRLYAKYSYLLD